MKAWIPLTVALMIGNAAIADETCVHPDKPTKAPDGATATKDEMIAGANAVKGYKEAMDNYLACIQGQIDAIPAADPSDKKTAELQKKQKDQMTKKYDAAVDEEKANVELFNVQLRAYKAKKQ